MIRPKRLALMSAATLGCASAATPPSSDVGDSGIVDATSERDVRTFDGASNNQDAASDAGAVSLDGGGDPYEIIKNPVDLAQISQISKFRSCAGHDFSGLSLAEDVRETERSMKHYFAPTAVLVGSSDKVRLFAPFDGTLETYSGASSGSRGGTIRIRSNPNVPLAFEFMHTEVLTAFKVGDKVKAGDHIGYASLGKGGHDFDLVLRGYKGGQVSGEVLDSVFNDMNTAVLAAYAARGVTPANVIVTRGQRDANPCKYDAGNASPDNWVDLN